MAARQWIRIRSERSTASTAGGAPIAEEYDPPRLLVGETFVGDVRQVIPYYGDGDELGAAFNIPFLQSRFAAEKLGAIVEETETFLPADCAPVWTGSNHDVAAPDPLGRRQPRRRPLLMLLALPEQRVPLLRRRARDARHRRAARSAPRPVSIKLAPMLNRGAARTAVPVGARRPARVHQSRGGAVAPVRRCRRVQRRRPDRRPAPHALHLTRDLVALRRRLPRKNRRPQRSRVAHSSLTTASTSPVGKRSRIAGVVEEVIREGGHGARG